MRLTTWHNPCEPSAVHVRIEWSLVFCVQCIKKYAIDAVGAEVLLYCSARRLLTHTDFLDTSAQSGVMSTQSHYGYDLDSELHRQQQMQLQMQSHQMQGQHQSGAIASSPGMNGSTSLALQLGPSPLMTSMMSPTLAGDADIMSSMAVNDQLMLSPVGGSLNRPFVNKSMAHPPLQSDGGVFSPSAHMLSTDDAFDAPLIGDTPLIGDQDDQISNGFTHSYNDVELNQQHNQQHQQQLQLQPMSGFNVHLSQSLPSTASQLMSHPSSSGYQRSLVMPLMQSEQSYQSSPTVSYADSYASDESRSSFQHPPHNDSTMYQNPQTSSSHGSLQQLASQRSAQYLQSNSITQPQPPPLPIYANSTYQQHSQSQVAPQSQSQSQSISQLRRSQFRHSTGNIVALDSVSPRMTHPQQRQSQPGPRKITTSGLPQSYFAQSRSPTITGRPINLTATHSLSQAQQRRRSSVRDQQLSSAVQLVAQHHHPLSKSTGLTSSSSTPSLQSLLNGNLPGATKRGRSSRSSTKNLPETQKKANRLARKAELARVSRRRKKEHLLLLESQLQKMTLEIANVESRQIYGLTAAQPLDALAAHADNAMALDRMQIAESNGRIVNAQPVADPTASYQSALASLPAAERQLHEESAFLPSPLEGVALIRYLTASTASAVQAGQSEQLLLDLLTQTNNQSPDTLQQLRLVQQHLSLTDDQVEALSAHRDAAVKCALEQDSILRELQSLQPLIEQRLHESAQLTLSLVYNAGLSLDSVTRMLQFLQTNMSSMAPHIDAALPPELRSAAHGNQGDADGSRDTSRNGSEEDNSEESDSE